MTKLHVAESTVNLCGLNRKVGVDFGLLLGDLVVPPATPPVRLSFLNFRRFLKMSMLMISSSRLSISFRQDLVSYLSFIDSISMNFYTIFFQFFRLKSLLSCYICTESKGAFSACCIVVLAAFTIFFFEFLWM